MPPASVARNEPGSATSSARPPYCQERAKIRLRSRRSSSSSEYQLNGRVSASAAATGRWYRGVDRGRVLARGRRAGRRIRAEESRRTGGSKVGVIAADFRRRRFGLCRRPASKPDWRSRARASARLAPWPGSGRPSASAPAPRCRDDRPRKAGRPQPGRRTERAVRAGLRRSEPTAARGARGSERRDAA